MIYMVFKRRLGDPNALYKGWVLVKKSNDFEDFSNEDRLRFNTIISTLRFGGPEYVKIGDTMWSIDSDQ